MPVEGPAFAPARKSSFMQSIAIFHPLLALVLLTLVVWVAMLLRRRSRMRQARLRPQDMPTRVLADEKFGEAQLPNNNLMNLFEMPVLFYVACILLYVLNSVDALFVSLAWAYVVLRAGQSGVAITYNNVLHRGGFYLLSCVALWAIWARIAWQLLA
jgi:hypothetical protein